MVRATLRSAVLLGLLACSVPAYAEVQNVKVGGEVNVRGFYRKSLRLNDAVTNGTGGGSTTVVDCTDLSPGVSGGCSAPDGDSSGDQFIQQLTAVDIGADLTENVAAQVRVINQRVWGSPAEDATNTTNSSTANADANQVQLSLANVTLKELFYSPLTVTLGRQRLWFGRGFIVGSRLLAADADPNGALAADEFTDLTAFDAIRGTLDLSGILGGTPLTLDGVFAKVNENEPGSADDINLTGVNLGTHFDSMNGEAEAYYWNKRDNDLARTGGAGGEDLATNPQANTLGFRGSIAPAKGLSTWGELAYQWGRRIVTSITFDAEGDAGDQYQAWAANLGLDYTLGGTAWTPTLGGEWIFYSGDNGDGGGSGSTVGSAIGGWDPVYRGQFTSLIREFQGAGFYMPSQSGSTVGGTFNNVTNSTTNQHQLALHAALKPLEDLSVDNRFTWFIADKGIKPTTQRVKTEKYFGSEWDVNANYAYTDDVQMGLVYGLFFPGSVFKSPHDNTAQELVTSVSVKF